MTRVETSFYSQNSHQFEVGFSWVELSRIGFFMSFLWIKPASQLVKNSKISENNWLIFLLIILLIDFLLTIFLLIVEHDINVSSLTVLYITNLNDNVKSNIWVFNLKINYIIYVRVLTFKYNLSYEISIQKSSL